MSGKTKIKLCGMFRSCDIEYVNEAQPDYIGFIVDFPKSHRSLSPDAAERLREKLRLGIKAVGVFVDAPIATPADMAKRGVIDLIQLHGQEDADYIARLRTFTDAPIIKAVKVTSAEDVSRAQTLGTDFLLLDSGTGTGKMFDHGLVDPERITTPFFLAGGLTPENCAQAARAMRPFAVDMSSGIETDRKKDRAKILAAVLAIRESD